MERESFDDEATAALMNELFVCVKVDREERPDVDSVYMDAVVALTGQGGWPLTVFLTPGGEPFFGGTYFPPEPRHGLPAFRQVLRAVADAYRERPEDVAAQAEALVGALRQSAEREPSREPLHEAIARRGGATACSGSSTRAGAASGTRRSSRPRRRSSSCCGAARSTRCGSRSTGWRPAGCTTSSAAASTATRSTREWLVPHFEKMLYDNALLVPPYLHAWLVTGEERYRDVAEQTLDYMVRELRLESGGFASAQDADTDGVEGLTYTWTEEEGAPRRAAAAVRARPLDPARRARRRDARAAPRDSRPPTTAVPRRQGDRVVERARARGARGGRTLSRK